MEIINLTKQEFISMLLNPKPFDRRQFGVLTLKKDKLYKIYYKDFFDTYITKDDSKIDSEVDSWLEIEGILDITLRSPKANLEKYKRLLDTKSANLITGVLSYRDLLVGVEMTYYKDYITLNGASEIVSREELDNYLEKVFILAIDLLDHNIVARDIKEDNILVNIGTGDVVLIDLDGIETTYGPDNYLEEYPRNKRDVYGAYNQMVERLYRKYEKESNIKERIKKP